MSVTLVERTSNTVGQMIAIIDHPEYGRILLAQGEQDGVLSWRGGYVLRLLPRDRFCDLVSHDGSTGHMADLDPDMMRGENPYRPLIPICDECVNAIARAVGL